MDVTDVKEVGVVGAGVMGHGIALAFALAGFPVFMSDVSEERLDAAMRWNESTARILAEEDLVTRAEADEALGRITPTTEVDILAAGSDFITEAISESIEAKTKLFATLDELAPSHAILVSNTSSFLLSEFTSRVERQDKIAVTHYFDPPAIVPGVEVARGPGTSDETFDITCAIMKKISHIPIKVVKDRRGYLLNTIQASLASAALNMWAQGLATAEDIDLGMRSTFGFRQPIEGVLMHLDLCGTYDAPPQARAEKVIGFVTRAGGDLAPETIQKMQEHYADGQPWFFSSETFDQVIEKRDREYVRLLKLLHPSRDR